MTIWDHMGPYVVTATNFRVFTIHGETFYPDFNPRNSTSLQNGLMLIYGDNVDVMSNRTEEIFSKLFATLCPL